MLFKLLFTKFDKKVCLAVASFTLAAFPLSGQCEPSALNGPGGANSLGPVAPSSKSRCVSTVGPEAL